MKLNKVRFLEVALMVAIFLALISPIFSAMSLQNNYIGGVNTWDKDSKVLTGTLTGGTQDYNVPTGFDVDMCLMSYDDQATPTLALNWSYSDGAVAAGVGGVVTITGDADEAIHAWLFDFPGH